MKHVDTKRNWELALCAVLWAAIAGFSPAQDEEYRTFTDAKGRSIEAKIVDKTEATVTLRPHGRTCRKSSWGKLS